MTETTWTRARPPTVGVPASPRPDGRVCWWAALTALPEDVFPVFPALAGYEDDPLERHIVRSID
ncbi:hypothetical protein ABT354_33925 [Streptomyces sp. NPDC000594]|uniref:hypothetical protein n=1 Tax=Streptomyces sp. NPDC000594 TaxID=3154261 RepID=UPI00331CAD78